jgi:phage-related protein
MADRFNIKFTIQAVDRFTATMKKLDQQLDSIQRKAATLDLDRDFKIDLDTGGAEARIEALRAQMDSIQGGNADIDVNVDSTGAIAELARIRAATEAMNSARIRVEIADDVARAQLARLRAERDALNDKPGIIRIFIKDYKSWRSNMDRIATTGRNVGEILINTFMGVATTFSSTLVPVIASTTGMLGSLGVMIGTTAGATMGLVSAFFGAGAAAAGFAAVAIPSIKGLHDTVDKIGDLDQKIQMAKLAGDTKKAAKYQDELNRVLAAMSPAQEKARVALGGFKEEYNGLVKAMESGVLTAYGGALQWVTSILENARPMIAQSVDVVNQLMDAMNRNIESADMQAFFGYLNTTAAPMLGTIAKAMGNFLMGIVNLMVAFAPLSQSMSGGFLEMSESFRKWTASLTGSEKFKAFTDYVRTNWPKVKQIFGDAIMGIIALFTGFAPYASEWMDTTKGMLSSFRAFAEGLGQNQQFQAFIAYISANAPRVTAMIGDLIQFLVQIGIALAPVGAKMVQFASYILNLATNFMKANPKFAEMIGWLIALAGGFFTLLPIIMTIVSFFGTFIATIIRVGSAVLSIGRFLITAGGAILRFGSTILQIIRVLFMFSGPVGIVIGIIVALAVAIYANWGSIGPWVAGVWAKVKSAVSTAMAVLPGLVARALAAVVSFVVNGVNRVRTFFQAGFAAARAIVQAALSAIRSIVANVIGAIVSRVASGVANLVSRFTSGFARARSVVTSSINAIRSIVTSVISAIVSRVVSGVARLVSSFQSGFSRARSVVTSAINAIRNIVANVISSIVSRVVSGLARMVGAFTSGMSRAQGIVRSAISVIKGLFNIDLSAQGRKIVQSVANGIKGAIGSVTGAISSVTSKIRNFLPFSPAKEGALRDLDKLNFGGTIAKSMTRQTGTVRRAMNNMMMAASPNVDFAVDNAYSRASSGYAATRAEQASMRARESRTIVEVPVYLNGREIAKASNKEQNRMNAREQARVAQFSRTGGA